MNLKWDFNPIEDPTSLCFPVHKELSDIVTFLSNQGCNARAGRGPEVSGAGRVGGAQEEAVPDAPPRGDFKWEFQERSQKLWGFVQSTGD